MRRSDFLDSARGQLAQYRSRARRSLYLTIKGIEPHSKGGMRGEEKARLQQAVRDQMKALGRRAFTGPVALKLSLAMTSKHFIHCDTIAKNLLDLLGDGLLYGDDRDIHALSVFANRGNTPEISIKVVPYRALVADLALAKSAGELDDDFDDFDLPPDPDDVLERLDDLRRDQRMLRRAWGSDQFDATVAAARRDAQHVFLGGARWSLSDIAHLTAGQQFAHHGGDSDETEEAEMWERVFRLAPLRMFLSDPPQEGSESKRYRQAVHDQVKKFKESFGWLLNPLLVPVRLELLVKPRHGSSNAHDLDNVVRNYVVRQILDVLKPPVPTRWRLSSPRSGLTGYQAWRLPPATERSKGFLAVALVANDPPEADVFSEVDEVLDRWSDSVDEW